MRKKSIILSSLSALFLIGIGTFFVSCDKEDLEMQREGTKDFIIAELYRGVELQQHDEYGSYLLFKDEETFNRVFDYLDTIHKNSQFDNWENGIEFSSLRRHEIDENVDGLKRYPNKAMAALINPNGYFQIGDVIYEDKKSGNEVYTIQDEERKLLYSEEQERVLKSTCYRADDEDSEVGNKAWNGIYTLKVEGEIDHWKHYITGNERIYLRTRIYGADADEGFWYSVDGDLSIKYSYRVTVDGSVKTAEGVYVTKDDDDSWSERIVDGDDICIDYVECKHSGAWGSGSVSVYTEVSQ